jgi:hypothetical protein
MRVWFPIALVVVFLLFLPAFVIFALDLLGMAGPVNVWLESRLGIGHNRPLPVWAAMVLFFIPFLIVLLYFLKLRRKPALVPSTFLWKKSVEDLHVNRLMQFLRKNILLILQLLVMIFLIYVVLAPRIHGVPGGGRNYILIIDNSASMSAKDISGQKTRLEWAKAEAIKEIEASSENDTGMVIVFSSTAEIRQSYTSNRSLLKKAVEDIQPTNHPTRFEEALSLAESLANPQRSTENEAVAPPNAEVGKERVYSALEGLQAEVHLYSDGRFPDVPDQSLRNLNLNFHSPLDASKADSAEAYSNNVGIVKLDAIRDETDPTKVMVFARVMNFRTQAVNNARVELDVTIAGEPLPQARIRSLDLPAREIIPPVPDADDPEIKAGRDRAGEQTVQFELTNIDVNADVTMHARLISTQQTEGGGRQIWKDAFSQDDEAWLVLGIVRRAKVALVSLGLPLLRELFKSKAMTTLADVTFFDPSDLENLNDFKNPAQEGKFDLVIFDRVCPQKEEDLPRANCFFIGCVPPRIDPLQTEKVQYPRIVGYTTSHPVMRGTTGWLDIGVGDSLKFLNLPPRTPRLVEGERDHVLLFTLARQSFTDLVCAFPIMTDANNWNTRWPLRPMFVLFMRNLVIELGNVRDAVTEESTPPSGIKRLSAESSIKTGRVILPDQKVITIERNHTADFPFSQTSQLGIYVATLGKETQKFAVNLFDPEESNITPRSSIRIGSTEIQAGPTRKQSRELWRWILVAGLLFLLVEWWIYNRRVVV